MATPLNLRVRIISPQKLIYEGQALSVTSKNGSGRFDILPTHANFMSFIESEPIIVRQLDKQKIEFKFQFAILYYTNNFLHVYTDISVAQIS